MEEELIVIREKRKNILIAFFAGLVLVFTLYLFLNSIANRIIGTVERVRGDYKPILTEVADTVSTATDDLNVLTGSGVNVLDTFTKEMPDKLAESVDVVRSDYNKTSEEFRHEYGTLKNALEIQFGLFKAELATLKNDVRNDIDWMKGEVEKWRKLIIFVSSVIGIIVFLTSLQDILENLRWLLSFVSGLFSPS